MFSEPLAQQLNQTSISVTINNVTQNFLLTVVDNSNYFLDIIFDKNIAQNTSLQILFSTGMVSQQNSLLSTSTLNASLYSYTLESVQKCFGSFYGNCSACASPMTLCNGSCYCNNNYY